MSEVRPEGARAFAHMISTVGDGELHAEASESLHKLTKLLRDVARERDSSASGRLTLVLDIEVDRKGIAEIEGSITVKEPKSPKRRGILYVTSGGNLTAEDPRQRKLDLRDVGGGGPKEAPRDVARGGE